jgi:hypothetical protein
MPGTRPGMTNPAESSVSGDFPVLVQEHKIYNRGGPAARRAKGG